MRRAQAIQILSEHREDLNRLGAKSLALFGSVARDEAQPESDVDVLVDFDSPPSFDHYMELKLWLEELLGARVDLVTRRSLKARVRPYVEQEAIYVP